MPYRLGGWWKLDDWLADNPPERAVLLEWLAQLMTSPRDVPDAQSIPLPGGVVYKALVPRTDVAVAFRIYDSPPWPANVRQVAIVRIGSAEQFPY